ncbi:MAG: 30S ribosomal protein S20 [Patescibacteria group bacterium]|nr:30S ribosomal protein S20 [Patescibacteria group bacterium]
MAITSSAKKALRQSERRRVHNLRIKRNLRDLIKELRGFVTDNQIEKAKELLPKAQKALDKAAKTGILKTNTVRRMKSSLAKAVNPKT